MQKNVKCELTIYLNHLAGTQIFCWAEKHMIATNIDI